MKSLKLYIFVFLAVTFHLSSADVQNGVLTPGAENKDLAMIDGENITEFQVFGYPSMRSRQYLNADERTDIIEKYIFEIILQKEGKIPSVLNSEDYKKNYRSLIEKNAAMKLKEDLINNRFNSVESSKKDNTNDTGEVKQFIENYIDSILNVFNVRFNDSLFVKISMLKTASVEELAEKIQSEYPNKVLISWNGNNMVTNDLVRAVKKVKPYHLKNLNDAKILRRLIDGSIINSILTLEAEKQGYMENPEVIRETEEQIKYLIPKKYLDIISSEDKFVPTKDEMIDYYIENKDDRSLWSRRKMWVYEIFKEYNNEDSDKTNDKINVAIELENIRQKVLNGEEFEKYAKFYPRPHTKDGELGFVFEDDYAMIGKEAFKMNSGDISDLIIQQKAISVIKVTQVQEPMLYKFDYVENIIRKKLTDSKRELFLENYKNELFKKYKVKILNQD